MLDSVEGPYTAPWNSSARDEQILGQVMRIAEQMGELAGVRVNWTNVHAGQRRSPYNKSGRMEQRIIELKASSGGRHVEHYGGVILCDQKVALTEARVLQTELSKELRKPVLIGGGLSETFVMKTIKESKDFVVVLLLTDRVLSCGHAMTEAAAAVKAERLLVPVMLAGFGYGYHMAHPWLSELELDGHTPEEMAEARKALLDVIPNTIAVDWDPALGSGLARAAAKEIRGRLRSSIAEASASRKAARAKRSHVPHVPNLLSRTIGRACPHASAPAPDVTNPHEHAYA